MGWLRYEWLCVKHAATEAWRSRRPIDLVVDGVIVLIAAGVVAALKNDPIPDTLEGAAIYGITALLIGVVMIFLLNLMLAPFRIYRDQGAELGVQQDRLQTTIARLEGQIRVLTERPQDMEKISIEEAISQLPKDRAWQLLQQGAYKQEFVVFGREMPAKYDPRNLRYVIYFNTKRLEKDIGWPYFENAVLVMDETRRTEVAGDGPFKPYLGSDDGQGQTLYTDLRVGKEQFEAFVRAAANV